MNQSMTSAQLETKLSIFFSLGLSFIANYQTPKERTFLLRNALHRADAEAFAAELGFGCFPGFLLYHSFPSLRQQHKMTHQAG